MMKKIISRLILPIIAVITLLPTASMTAEAFGNTAKGFDEDNIDLCRVVDDAELFSDAEEEEINELIQDTSSRLGLYISIYLSGVKRSDYDTDVFSDEEYDREFGRDTDGLLYYMDLSGSYSAYDRISRSGKAILIYKGDYIEQKMLPSIFASLPASGEPIVADQIKRGIKKILDVVEEHYREPGMFDTYYDDYTHKYIYMKNGQTRVARNKPLGYIMIQAARFAGIGAIIGIITAIITFFSVKSHYKFKPSCNPNVYVVRDRTRFTRRDDILIRSHTSKVRIQSSSGGGGGGHGHYGGGHGGGGGSHGRGGGGHR